MSTGVRNIGLDNGNVYISEGNIEIRVHNVCNVINPNLFTGTIARELSGNGAA